jgi:hypothetical protein
VLLDLPASTDRVPTRAELAGLLLADSTAEGIDLPRELYFDQTGTVDHRLPPCARQGTGDSAGPQVDVLERSLWDRFLDADISNRHPPTRL